MQPEIRSTLAVFALVTAGLGLLASPVPGAGQQSATPTPPLDGDAHANLPRCRHADGDR